MTKYKFEYVKFNVYKPDRKSRQKRFTNIIKYNYLFKSHL